MTLGVCWVVTLSVLMFSRDVSRILIALGVMLAHLVAVILLRCQFSAFGYPLERNVVAPITRVGSCGAWAISSRGLHRVACVRQLNSQAATLLIC